MAETRDNAVERDGRDFGRGVLDQHQGGFRRSDLGDRGGHRARQLPPARNGGLRRRPGGCDRIDEIGIEQKRRACEHVARDLGLIGGKADDDRGRRVLAGAEGLSQRRAH